jgi:thioredoxin 2
MKVVCPHCLKINNIPKKDSYKKANCGECKSSLLDTKPIELTSANFDEVVVNSDIPVVVDFWAPWCGPCKMMAPVFEKVAAQYPLKVMFVKVDTDAQQQLGARMNIRSIPTMIAYKDGVSAKQVSGALNESALKEFISSLI